MTREDALALADQHYIDLFRVVRRAGRKDCDKAKAVSFYLSETIIAEAAAMRERAAKLCDERGADEQEGYGLTRAAQNYFRARDAIRALPTAD